jgi:hypothetical protein
MPRQIPKERPKKVLKTKRAKSKIRKVLEEFKAGTLKSGSKKGPQVVERKQAIAIALSEARKRKKK